MGNKGYTAAQAAIGLLIVALLIGGGYLLLHNKHQTQQSASSTSGQSGQSSNSSSPYANLSPATVPSRVAECNQQISYASNGVPGPIECSNGDLNVTEWNALAALEPTVLSLGYSASATQVQSALCSDVEENISNPIEETVYSIAALYYGWNFSSNPSQAIANGTCQNVDD